MEKWQCKSISLKCFVFVACLCPFLPTSEASFFSSSNDQPGLEFKPEAPKEHEGSTLIWFSPRNYRTYVDNLNDFLRPYKSPSLHRNIVNCSYDYPPPKGTFCNVHVGQFNICTEQFSYGYDRQSPCVFLKLKNIPNWIPRYYNDTSDLPKFMPEDLKSDISQREQQDRRRLKTVWVTCEGETNVDIESIGPLAYYPSRGFPAYYFPMENEDQYLSPLIAIHFESPQIGIAIFIECKMWARNIAHNRDSLLGLVRFQLLVD